MRRVESARGRPRTKCRENRRGRACCQARGSGSLVMWCGSRFTEEPSFLALLYRRRTTHRLLAPTYRFKENEEASMKLHFHPVSTASRPVVLFCADANISYEPVVIDI